MSQTVFSALLKYWRRKCGMSQLDLALAAEVSARHVSFLESRRASPSETMVLRLLGVLDVSAREQNEALRAIGLDARFPESGAETLSPAIASIVTKLMRQQDPYPFTVLDATYNIIQANDAALKIFSNFCLEPPPPSQKTNIFDHVFNPSAARPFIQNWHQLGAAMVARLHLEALRKSNDRRLWNLLDRVMSYPDVPQNWKHFNAEHDAAPICPLIIGNGSLTLSFVMTVTAFSMPRQIEVGELRFESYFPMDSLTDSFCQPVAQLTA